MKKVFVTFLTVLLILLAIAAVQAYAVPLMPALQVTEGDVSVTAAVPEADENKEVVEKEDPVGKIPSKKKVEEEIVISDGETVVIEVFDLTETEETDEPTEEPTETPAEETVEPTEEPTEVPTEETDEPTEEPTETPAEETVEPTEEPTEVPTEETAEPTEEPTEVPTEKTAEPTVEPTENVVEEIDRDVFVTIKGNTVYAPYDGSRHVASGYVVTGISNGAYTEADFIFTGKAYVELVDAGVSYMGLTDDMFINKNNQFNVYFEIEDGYVEVSPINVEVEVIGMTESAEYDGDVHSVEGYTFRQIFPIGQELYSEESFEFLGKAFAERTEAGISFMGLNGSSFKNINPNFGRVLFHVTDGYIEVTPSEEMYEELLSVEESVEPVVEDVFVFGSEPTEAPAEETVEPMEEPVETVKEETVEPAEEPAETVTEETVKEEKAEIEESAETAAEEVVEYAEEGEEIAYLETMNFAAGTVIYSEADMESEVIMTLEEETSFPILTVYDSNWIEIQLNDASGFVFVPFTEETDTPVEEDTEKPGEESRESETTEEISENITEVSDEEAVEVAEESSVEKVLLKSGTNIYTEADENSEILKTLEEDTAFPIVSVLTFDWLEIQLDPETTGYVIKPEEMEIVDEDSEAKILKVTVPAGTNVRVAADGMSEILYTFEEDTEMVIVSREGDWLLINVSDEISGYIFAGDVQLPEEEAETVDERKVTIFTSRRIVMPMGADIELTSHLEGFEEGDSIAYQWECDKGKGFEPIDGATGDTYTYKASVESLTWGFRLNVTVNNAEEAAPEAAE